MRPQPAELRRVEGNAWRKELLLDFECPPAETELHERPAYEAANRFLINA